MVDPAEWPDGCSDEVGIPSLAERTIPRPGTAARLTDAMRRPVVVVTAPAGYGKTTAVAQWARRLDRPVAWLRLEDRHNDPGRLLTCLVAALGRVDPSLGHDIAAAVSSGAVPASDVVAAILARDLLEHEDPMCLVLDDLHLLTNPIGLGIVGGLVSRPPVAMSLVLVSREQPALHLAKARLEDRVGDVGAADLRLSSAEIAATLDVLGVSLTDSDRSRLEQLTEGWVAGVRMAALAARPASTGEQGLRLPGAAGTERIAGRYLLEEVLGSQDRDVQDFLVETSVLTELTDELCTAVTQRSDAPFVLARLWASDLFLSPLDEDRTRFRYHPLFAVFLADRARQLGVDTSVLHRRAARWYVDHAMPASAVEHALAAHDMETAATLVDRQASDVVSRGGAATLARWAEAIPARLRHLGPHTDLALAWADLFTGAYGRAEGHVLAVETAATAAPADIPVRPLRAECGVIRALLAYRAARFDLVMALGREALELAPESDHRVRGLARFALGSARRAVGEVEVAMADLTEGLSLAQAAGDQLGGLLCLGQLGALAVEQGRLHLAAELTVPAAARLERSEQLSPYAGLVFGSLAEIHYARAQVEEGLWAADRALTLNDLGGFRSASIGGHVLVSRLAQLRGDLQVADREVEEALSLTRPMTPAPVAEEVLAQRVRLYLARGDLTAAAALLEDHGISANPADPRNRQGGGPLSVARGALLDGVLRLALSRMRSGEGPRHARATTLLAGELVEEARHRGLLTVVLETLLVRGQVQALRGDLTASRIDYLRALELAEPAGFVAVFLEQGAPVVAGLEHLAGDREVPPACREHAARIVAASAELTVDDGRQPAPGGGLLTGRETEVLQLLRDGLRYREIADRLFVSINTVRYHVKSAYAKLEARNRTEALATARRRGLL